MKRRYPISLFLMGLLLNLGKFIWIALIGIVFLVIGFMGNSVCTTIGVVIMILYVLICLIQQIVYVVVFYQKGDNAEFNSFLDMAFTKNDPGGKNRSSRQRVIDHVNEIIEEQNKDKTE